MKNPLQLELHNKLKHANQFIFSKQYHKAIQAYSQGIELYQANKFYNDHISQQYLSLFYSLRGNAYSIHLKQDLAEEDFEKSLKINHFDCITLIRRAKHFIQKQRYTQAIFDIDLALLYDPQNLSYFKLFDQIDDKIKQIQDKQLKFHINWLISRIKYRYQPIMSTQDSDSQTQKNDEKFLNFSKLKKIDRKSTKLNQNHLDKLKNIIEFKQDQVIQYEPQIQTQIKQQKNPLNFSEKQIKQKILQQAQELKELQQNQKQQREKLFNDKFGQRIILTKSHGRSRHSILRKSSLKGSDLGLSENLFASYQGNNCIHQSQNQILSALSIKNIDGKIIRHQKQNIKFQPLFHENTKKYNQNLKKSEFFKQNYGLNLTNLNSNQRKSCLRNSKKFDNLKNDPKNQLSLTQPGNFCHKINLFQNLLNIDGSYHKKQPDNILQQQKVQTPIKIEYQSSDDEGLLHDIYGSKKQKQILIFSDKNILPNILEQKLKQKKSILRKSSLLEVSASSKNSLKRSVNFNAS